MGSVGAAAAGPSAPGKADVEGMESASSAPGAASHVQGGRDFPSSSPAPDVADTREDFVVPEDAILRPMLKRWDEEELVVVSGRGGKGGKAGKGGGAAAGGVTNAIGSTAGAASLAAVAEEASGSTGPTLQPGNLEDVEPAVEVRT